MMILILFLFILLLALFVGGYIMFKSVFDMKDFKRVPASTEFIDSEKDPMRPTARLLYQFQTPYIEQFKKLPFEDLYVTSYDGLKLHGYFLKGSNNKVVLCYHGYKSAPEFDFSDKIGFYQQAGVNVICVDDRAHGKSEGRYLGFSELDKYDIQTWVNQINELFVNPDIYLHGISMGGASVIHALSLPLKNVKGVIDDCGFDSIDSIVHALVQTNYHVPYFPLAAIAQLFSKVIAHVGFKDSLGIEIVKKTTVPILFIHGKQDHFVPCEMSEKMFEACASKKEFLCIPEAGHAASYCMRPLEYKEAVYHLMDLI